MKHQRLRHHAAAALAIVAFIFVAALCVSAQRQERDVTILVTAHIHAADAKRNE